MAGWGENPLNIVDGDRPGFIPVPRTVSHIQLLNIPQHRSPSEEVNRVIVSGDSGSGRYCFNQLVQAQIPLCPTSPWKGKTTANQEQEGPQSAANPCASGNSCCEYKWQPKGVVVSARTRQGMPLASSR